MVALELAASLHRDHAERLRRAVAARRQLVQQDYWIESRIIECSRERRRPAGRGSTRPEAHGRIAIVR